MECVWAALGGAVVGGVVAFFARGVINKSELDDAYLDGFNDGRDSRRSKRAK